MSGFALAPGAAAAFWEKVDKNGPIVRPELGPCWVWTRARDDFWYGRVNVGDHKTALAHRVAFVLERGPIPDELNVLHRCDNPPCVRPDHLWTGTDADNVADMDAKGRRVTGLPPIGSANKWAKLTEEQVADIRRRRNAGEKLQVIAASVGLTKQGVYRICARKCWRHVA